MAITRFRGDTGPITRTLYDGDGLAQSLSTATEIKLTVRAYAEAAEAVLERTMTDGGIRIVSAAAGTFQVTWDGDAMAALEPGVWCYDIEVTFPGAEEGDDPIIVTTECGEFIVLADVSRPAPVVAP